MNDLESKYIFLPEPEKPFVRCILNETILVRYNTKAWEHPIEMNTLCLN